MTELEDRLSRDQRIVALRDEGLSLRGIAAILDMPISTIAGILSKANAVTCLPRGRLSQLREITREVCDQYGLTMGEIVGPSRQYCVAHPRQKAMALAYATGKFSYPMLGRFFNRDHSTAIHSVRAYKARMAGSVALPDPA